MQDLTNIEKIRTMMVPHLEFCVEVGLVDDVRRIVKAYDQEVCNSGDQALIKVFRDANDWLSEAIQYEIDNGPGSRADRNHPRLTEVLARVAAHQPIRRPAPKSIVSPD